MKRVLACASVVVIAGCLTHLAPSKEDRCEQIAWQDDADAARARAAREHKPWLVVMIAGEREAQC